MPAEPALPAGIGFFGDERHWFQSAVREATGEREYVAPAPARCGGLLEILKAHGEPDHDAAKAWLTSSVAAFVVATDAMRKFWPLTPDKWVAWVGLKSPSAAQLNAQEKRGPAKIRVVQGGDVPEKFWEGKDRF